MSKRVSHGKAEPPTKWEVYRFELVFFNSNENRWQLFQEHSSGSTSSRQWLAGFYRIHIEAMLRSVREAIAVMAKDKPGTFTCDDPAQSADNDDEPLLIDFSKLGKGFKRLAIDDDLGSKMVQKVRESLRHQGFDLNPLEDILSQIENIRHQGPKQAGLNRAGALQLLSALPFSRHWELPGRLFFPKISVDSSGDPEASEVNLKTRLFACRLKYFDPKEKADWDIFKAEQALGYQVGIDLAGVRKRNDESINPKSYYAFVGDVEKDEQKWYGFYGLLQDALQRALASKQQRKGKDPSEVYLIAYPLRICGWDHLLHIWVRTTSSEALTAADLLQDWRTLGYFTKKGDDLNIFKECLREYLVQTRIAAFQSFASRHLMKQRECNVGHSFCMHAHNLVRVDWLQYDDAMYGYPLTQKSPHEHDPTPAWANLSEGSERFDKRNCHVLIVRESPTKIRGYAPWDDSFARPLNSLFKGTSHQRMIEQFH